MMVCDFCSSKPVVARYHAKDFVMAEKLDVGIVSVGDWAACSVCEILIDTNQWDRVIDRSVKTFYENHPYFIDILYPAIIREALWDAYANLVAGGYKKIPLEG